MSKGSTNIIDCDVHISPEQAEEIRQYLPQPWKHRFHIRRNIYYKKPIVKGSPTKKEAASNVKQLEQHLEQHQITQAILIPIAHVSANHDPDYCTAISSAYNQWQADTFLGQDNQDGRLKGTILISHRDPQAAAQEIKKWAEHPHFVQVMMESGCQAPFGQRHYYPIYEACQQHQLPIVIHPAGEGMGVNKPVWQGHPSLYVEYETGYSFGMQSHLVSLLTSGLFESYPDLRITIAEGGVTWLPPLIWRLDQEWKALRSEVPWVKKFPSEYLQEHIRFTTQPLERPERDEDLLEVLEMLDAENLLMFSSSFPAGNFQSIAESLPSFPPAWSAKIYEENAKKWLSL